MADLLTANSKGSFLMLNFSSEKEVPTSGELKRLLGINDFRLYKSRGPHRSTARTLSRLLASISSENSGLVTGRWTQKDTSHFLFCEQELKYSVFFNLKYTSQCLGSYYVDQSELDDLADLLDTSDRLERMVGEVIRWPEIVAQHKKYLIPYGLEDSVINSFDVDAITRLTNGYGEEAVSCVTALVRSWHEEHSWEARVIPMSDAVDETGIATVVNV